MLLPVPLAPILNHPRSMPTSVNAGIGLAINAVPDPTLLPLQAVADGGVPVAGIRLIVAAVAVAAVPLMEIVAVSAVAQDTEAPALPPSGNSTVGAWLAGC